MGILSVNTNEHLYHVVKNNVLKDFNDYKTTKLNPDISCIVDGTAKKILFIRDVGLGDILMTLPTVCQLKKIYPNSVITYASKLVYHELLRLYTFIDKLEDVLSIDERLKYYDVVHDLRNKLENYRERKNQRHRVDSIAEVCDIKLSSKTISMNIPSQSVTKVKKLLEKNNVPQQKKLIGIVSRGTFRLRSWPLDYVIRLCLLSNENSDLHYILLSNDRDYGFDLPNVLDLTGKLSLVDLAAVVKRCDAVISSDTGTLHMAGALDVPVIGIFGSIPPEIRTMYYKKCYNLSASGKIDCSPCFDRQFGDRQAVYRCLHMDTKCMRRIKPEDVYERLKYILFKEDKAICDFCGAYDLYFYKGYGKKLTVCNHCGRQIARSDNGD